jgi:F0F1-type ATP synthase membrane subunit b/b'
MIPDLSTVCVIVFVLILSVVLDRLLLRPVTAVMQQREGAIRAAQELAETSHARAQAAIDELEAKTRSARADVYRQMEEKRRAALESRAGLIGETRREVERSLSEATERLKAQASVARAQLERDADTLASTIVERVIGRKAY